MTKINIFTNAKRSGSTVDELDLIADRYLRNLHSGDPKSMGQLWRTTDTASSRLTIFCKDGTVKQYTEVK
jgi:hypothetical protein